MEGSDSNNNYPPAHNNPRPDSDSNGSHRSYQHNDDLYNHRHPSAHSQYHRHHHLSNDNYYAPGPLYSTNHTNNDASHLQQQQSLSNMNIHPTASSYPSSHNAYGLSYEPYNSQIVSSGGAAHAAVSSAGMTQQQPQSSYYASYSNLRNDEYRDYNPMNSNESGSVGGYNAHLYGRGMGQLHHYQQQQQQQQKQHYNSQSVSNGNNHQTDRTNIIDNASSALQHFNYTAPNNYSNTAGDRGATVSLGKNSTGAPSSSPVVASSNNASSALQHFNYMIQNTIDSARGGGGGGDTSNVVNNGPSLSNVNIHNGGTVTASTNASQSNNDNNARLSSDRNNALPSHIANDNNTTTRNQLLSNYAKATSTSHSNYIKNTAWLKMNATQRSSFMQALKGTGTSPQGVLMTWMNQNDNAAVAMAKQAAAATLSDSRETSKNAAVPSSKISPSISTMASVTKPRVTNGTDIAKTPGRHSVKKPSTTTTTATATPANTKPSKSPKSLVHSNKNRIEIPAEFPPRHAYRATAAYSLLRTLSKELRLSPFTLQSFLSALMLPIPSRLLGEIHVRVMRVLFADIGMGSYARHGQGEGPMFLKRIVRGNKSESIGKGGDDDVDKAGSDNIVEEFVRARSCDNLFYMDNLTWPLFYEDYAVATEDKFLNDLDDNEEFIDLRSIAMMPDDPYPTSVTSAHEPRMHVNKAAIPSYPGQGWIDRCPVGPFGRRNPTTGRFVCCPFHVHAAMSKARQQYTVASKTAPLPKKRKRSNKTKARKQYASDGSSSDSGNDSDSDEDFVSTSNRSKATVKRGRPRKYPKVDPNTPASRVNNFTIPQSSSQMPVFTGMPQAPMPPPMSQPGYVMPRPHIQLVPILVPPIPPHPSDLNATVVSKDTEDTIARYFLEGDLFKAAVNSTCPQFDESTNNDNDEITDPIKDAEKDHIEDLNHMAPIKQLRRGIPYHHLSIEMKLIMIEFLLDELLDVGDISKELTLRRELAEPHHYLYGEVPQKSEFDELVNADECLVCGLEGDLLCCDACPASFHKICIGMTPYAKLPDGKWWCPECRVPDASRMGPIQAENRPLIGWFTLNELREESSSHESMIQSQVHGGMQLIGQPLLGFPQPLTNINNQDANLSKWIPVDDVEFLVTCGNVFARHRQSHKRFDPLNPFPAESLGLKEGQSHPLTRDPVQPLRPAEVIELLKLIGPDKCLKLPWRRLIFNATKAFLGDKVIAPVNSPLQDLIQHQQEARRYLTNYSDSGNPLEFDNKYRKAPPIPKVKEQLGQFVLPSVLPDMFAVTPKVASQFGVKLWNNLSLNSVMAKNTVDIALLQDVSQCVRDQLFKLGKVLFDSSLLDHRWGTLDSWKSMIRQAKSFSRLSGLLVRLVDACSPRAFQREWYSIRDNENLEETARLSNNNNYSSIPEGWTSENELRLRKWQRCSRANALSLLISEEGMKDILNNIGGRTKRGKKTMLSDEMQSDVIEATEQIRSADLELTSDGNKTQRAKPSDSDGSPITVHTTPKTNGAVIAATTSSCPSQASMVGIIAEPNSDPIVLKSNGAISPSENESQESPVSESFEVGAITSSVAKEDTPPKSKKKKKRRTTRSLSPVPNSKKRCSERLNVLRKEIEILLGIDTCESNNRVDGEIHRLKLDLLEKIVAERNEKTSYFFAIAGKKMFEPEGIMQTQTVRYLARNAGSVRAPFIAYETPFEVGESTTCHYWRKMTLNASTFEDFMLSLKFINEHINKAITGSSTSIVNKISKPEPAPIASVIRCEQFDQITGVKEYFVVNTNKNQGRWQYEVNIDLPPFISYRFEKGKQFRDEYKKRKLMEQKSESEKKLEEAKEAKKAAERKQAEAKKRQEVLLKHMARNSTSSAKTPAKSPTTKPSLSPEQAIESALIRHRISVFELLAASAARGEQVVPSDLIFSARKSTQTQLELLSSSLKGFTGKSMSEAEISVKIGNAESEAVKQFTEYLRQNMHKKT